MAELADALDSKSSDGNIVWVRAPPPVPIILQEEFMAQNNAIMNIGLLVVFIVMIYFLMIRPQRKKDKADREMRESLRVGDEIITIGGVVGKVEKITEKTVVISTGAGRNKIEFLKTAIANVSRTESSAPAPKKEEQPVEEKDDIRPNRDKKVTPKKLTKKSDSEE